MELALVKGLAEMDMTTNEIFRDINNVIHKRDTLLLYERCDYLRVRRMSI